MKPINFILTPIIFETIYYWESGWCSWYIDCADPGFESRVGVRVSFPLFHNVETGSGGPTQPPILWVPELSSGG